MTAPLPQEAAAPSVRERAYAVAEKAHVAAWTDWDESEASPRAVIDALDAAGLLRSDPEGTETEVVWSVVDQQGRRHNAIGEAEARAWAADWPGSTRVQKRTLWRDA